MSCFQPSFLASAPFKRSKTRNSFICACPKCFQPAFLARLFKACSQSTFPLTARIPCFNRVCQRAFLKHAEHIFFNYAHVTPDVFNELSWRAFFSKRPEDTAHTLFSSRFASAPFKAAKTHFHLNARDSCIQPDNWRALLKPLEHCFFNCAQVLVGHLGASF
jgi:hypothetical protein